ncbi:MAG: substrate-binding domain-containing protein, partial [Planctomycetota bacterium]
GIAGALLRGAEGTLAASELAAEDFPSVIIAGRSPDPKVSFVDGQSRQTSKQAVQHLIALGHRRIGLGTHVVDDDDHKDRREGYLDALASAGIPVDRRLIVRTPVDQRGGVLMLERLLSLEEPPTAIYFTNPLPTVGALIRCAQLSIRVPEELSIIGFDDTDVRYRTYPAFSAVTQDAQAIAVDATRWLLARINGNAFGVHRELRETQFHVEESTAFSPPSAVRLSPTGVVVRD